MRSRRRGSVSTPFSLFAFQDIITSVTGIMILVTLMLALDLLQRKASSPPNQTAAVTADLESAIAENERQIAQLQAELGRLQSELRDATRFNASQLRDQLADTRELQADVQRELQAFEREKQQIEQQRARVEQERQRRASDAETIDQLADKIQETKEQIQELKQSNRLIFNPGAGSDKNPWLVEVDAAGLTAARMGRAERPTEFGDVPAFQRWLAQRNVGSDYFVLLVKPGGIDAFHEALERLQQRNFDVGYDLLATDRTAIDPETGAGVK